MDGPRLPRQGRTLEVRTGRSGLHTTASLLVDDAPVAQGRGIGHVLLDVPGSDEPAPAVLVVAPLPGTVARVVLLVPRSTPDAGTGETDPRAARALALVTAERHPFDPVPGTTAARLQAFEEHHPRLWASRHVVAGVARVLVGLLGLAVLLQTLVRPLLRWLAGLVPDVDLPRLPLPDLDLPSIPWPDLDLPDLSLPGWLAAVLASAKYWGPVLVGIGVAVVEVRRKRRRDAGRAADGEPSGPVDDAADAHRRP